MNSRFDQFVYLWEWGCTGGQHIGGHKPVITLAGEGVGRDWKLPGHQHQHFPDVG